LPRSMLTHYIVRITIYMQLDLHGVRHHEVELMVENWVLMNQSSVPLTIICGNSQRMIDIVYSVLTELDLDSVAMDQFGRIVVRRI
jgi:hypothetical protein